AVLLRKIFAAAVFGRVFFKRHARVSALLRAPVNQSILADVEIARAGAASPFVRFTSCDVVLETVEARKPPLAHAHDFFEDFGLAGSERLQLSLAVVQDAH